MKGQEVQTMALNGWRVAPALPVTRKLFIVHSYSMTVCLSYRRVDIFLSQHAEGLSFGFSC